MMITRLRADAQAHSNSILRSALCKANSLNTSASGNANIAILFGQTQIAKPGACQACPRDTVQLVLF